MVENKESLYKFNPIVRKFSIPITSTRMNAINDLIQSGFKLKQKGIKVFYLGIRGYNFTSKLFIKQRISQVDNLEVNYSKGKGPKKLKIFITYKQLR